MEWYHFLAYSMYPLKFCIVIQGHSIFMFLIYVYLTNVFFFQFVNHICLSVMRFQEVLVVMWLYIQNKANAQCIRWGGNDCFF